MRCRQSRAGRSCRSPRQRGSRPPPPPRCDRPWRQRPSLLACQPPQPSAALTRVQLAPLVCSLLTSFSGFKSRRSDKVPPCTFASLLVCRIAGFAMRTNVLSLSRATPFRIITPQQGGAVTAGDCAQWRPGRLPSARVRNCSNANACNCRQLAATWHRASGESRCRTKTCVAFERGALTPDRRERGCVWWCPTLRLQRRAQATHAFERGALTLTARDQYIISKQNALQQCKS